MAPGATPSCTSGAPRPSHPTDVCLDPVQGAPRQMWPAIHAARSASSSPACVQARSVDASQARHPGMACYRKPVNAQGGKGSEPFSECRAPFRPEKLAPSAKLTKVRIPLRPAEAALAPLGAERDTLPSGRVIHALTLTYKLAVAEAGKHTVTLPLLNRCGPLFLRFAPLTMVWLPQYGSSATYTLARMPLAAAAVSERLQWTLHNTTASRRCLHQTRSGARWVHAHTPVHASGSWAEAVVSAPRLRPCCRFVYDGELEGQMTMLCDANKRLLKVSDIYPEDVQLGKGDYTIRAQLRHDDTGARLH